jgi:hypothetical protein
MQTITVRFTTRWPYNPTSPVIARLSGSKRFSHVMNIIDGMAHEATMLDGCRVVPIEQAMIGVAAYQDMTVPVPNLAVARTWGEDRIGVGYDFAGAFGIPLLMSDDWGDWSKWWCSEFSFFQIGMGGTWMLDKDQYHRVTPNHQLMCNFPKSPIVICRR